MTGWTCTCRGLEGLDRSFSPVRHFGVGRFPWQWIVLLCFAVRVGEASHPGPSSHDSWTLGLCNPSGLNGKVDQCAHLGGDVWLVSETHLSRHGLSKFKHGLQALKAPWQALVPGAPCPTKGVSTTGTHTGVMLLSRFPARAVPHNFDLDLFASARMQVAGVAVHGTWVTIGMLYGVPCNASHKQARFQTESMLADLVDRVGMQAAGPRAIGGDFNFAVEELSQLQRLHALGWREVQDIAAWRWAREVTGTGRGAKRIDQLWISPELQLSLSAVELVWDQWADHAAVVATFSDVGDSMFYDAWRQPGAFPWPKPLTGDFVWNQAADPTVAYAELWSQVELRARAQLALEGRGVSGACCGRAQTLETKRCRYHWSPCRTARYGEVSPGFLGVSLQHARYFRQLRRLQALHQQLQKSDLTWNARLNRDDTWRAVRCAVGFPGGFGPWWTSFGLHPVFPSGLPTLCPSAAEVKAMFESFHSWVKTYEGQLAQRRFQYGKQRRESCLNYVFKDCQAELPPQVDSLIQRVEVDVAEVRPDDSSVVLTAPTALLPDLPVVAGGKILEVIHHEEDQLWVQDVQGLEEGMTLTQEKAVVSDQALLAQFEAVWEPRWNKISHVVEGQWEQICGFVKAHFRPLAWTYQPWTGERFRKAVVKKMVFAAKGADGVSQPDLAALPPSGHQAYAAMFASIESGGSWPRQLATGFVSSLAKHPDAQDVDSYRPITVYGLPYRIWSSERAKEALRCLSQVVPASVQGGLPTRQAKAIWYSVAQALEDAYLSQQPLHGLLMDIRKCFNAIPRLPLWQALLCLGFPPHVLQAWVQFVSGQVRRFKVRKSVGSPVSSVCGLPEGCALSVFGMVVIDWMLDVWLRQLQCSPRLQAFIDDWGVMFGDASAFDRIWTCLQEFTHQLDLTIDMNKTRVWSTDAVARSQYRLGPVQVAHAARNLGAHQNFSRHCWNSGLLQRIAQMPAVWTRLRASLSSYRHKHIALRMLGWPKALHGCSVVHVGQEHLKRLRSGAMRGLRADRKGANPVLHLVLTHLCGDPEAWMLVQTLRDARDLGGLSRIDALLGLFATSLDLPSNGPTAVLNARLERLGWKVGGNGLVQDGLGTFSIVSLAWDEMLLRIHLAWGAVLFAAVSHRPSFQGIQNADLLELHSALRPYGPADLVVLRCHLDGTLYTQNGRAKFQVGVTNRCPWCDAVDGFFHRAWECSYFEDCRKHVSPAQRAMVPNLPLCFSAHGWPTVLPEWEILSQYFLSLADSPACPVSPVRGSCGTWVDLFVDGTSAYPSEPKLRYAAWAVTWASGGVGCLQHQLLLGGHVHGLNQSAFRAELTAVLAALRWARQHGLAVRIWSDCLSAVRGVQKLLQGGVVQNNRAHSDLWMQIFDVVHDWPDHQVKMVKVVSHAESTRARDPVEAWAYWHNQLVDAAAASINQRRSRAFWEAWQNLSTALTVYRQLHRAVLQVLLLTGRKAMEEQQSRPKLRTVTVDTTAAGTAPPPAWQIPCKMFARHGQRNVEALHSWWSAIGSTVMGGSGDLVFVSGLQLFLDFYLTTQYFGPWVYKKKWFVSAEEAPVAARQPWGARTKAFLMLFQTYLKAHQIQICKKLTRPSSSAVSKWVVSYRLRYGIDRLRELDRYIYSIAGRQLTSTADIQDFSPQ